MNEEVPVVAVAPIRKRRPKATAQERADWAKRFAESALGQREFCRQHGLALMTFQRWLARVEKEGQPGLPSQAQFTEVKWAAAMAVPDSDCRWAAELCRAGGWTLRLAHDVPVGLLEQLLRLC